jgi:hypothetical protein
MKKYKIDDKGRIRLSKIFLNYFKDSLRYDFNLENSTFLINNNFSKPHHH